MAPRLVNTAPGVSSEPTKPGQAIHLGIKSEDASALLGTLKVDVALSSLVQRTGYLPDTDPELAAKKLEVSLETSERRRPLDLESFREVSGQGFTITKGSNLLTEASVYELKIPIQPNASVLARVKLKKKAWAEFNADFLDLMNVTGVYFGLEHGTYNTGAFLFLRNNGGVGSLVVGGPQQNYGGPRPGQDEAAFDWKSLAVEESFELFLLFNTVGRPAPFLPQFTPLVEVWVKTALVTSPVEAFAIPVQDLGNFPPDTAHYSNRRQGPSEYATLFIGNVGKAGDVVEVEDWELYPDYHRAVLQGEPLPNTELRVLPDAPVTFNAADGKATELNPGSWMKSPFGITPVESLYFQPGRRLVPLYYQLEKSSGGAMVVQKEEPRLELLESGAMVEGWIAGESESSPGQSTMMGFGLDDGEKSYRTFLLNDGTVKSVGIQKNTTAVDVMSQGYLTPGEVDWTSLKFVRMTIDRLRGKALLYVEDENSPAIEVDLSDIQTPVLGHGKVYFGHMDQRTAIGKFRVSFLNYLTRYYAWEKRDGQMPDHSSVNAAVRFTETAIGNGLSVLDPDEGNSLLILKSDYTVSNAFRYFRNETDFSPDGGFLVDFRAKVETYSNHLGQQNAPGTHVGVGLTVFLGTKRLQLSFFDCSMHGKRIGILPGSGTVNDILNQTALGRAFSAPVDFLNSETYRVVYRAYGKIEIWAGTVRNKPIISIPWRNDTDGFDLPLDTTAPSVAFGHFEPFSSSISRWDFIRWGQSNGYEISVRTARPEGYESYHFGGRSMVLSEFEEG